MHGYVYKCAMVIWKYITLVVPLDIIYYLMDMYIKICKIRGNENNA